MPLPSFVLQASFVMAFDISMGTPRLLALLVAWAVLWRIGFEGLCRPGELLSLQKEDIRLRRRFSGGPTVIAIRNPKNRRFAGAHQFRLLRSEATTAWCECYMLHVLPGARLWPASPQVFSETTRYVMRTLGLEKCGFTPSSLRAGGATWLFEQGMSVQTLQYVGGWSSDRSLSCYIQEAMAVTVVQALPEAFARDLESRLADRIFIWERPPASPWPVLAHQLATASRRHLARWKKLSRWRR